MEQQRIAELGARQARLARLRAAAAPVALALVLTSSRPLPPLAAGVALASAALLAATAAATWVAAPRARTARQATALAVAGLAADAVTALGLVLASASSPDTAVWILLYLLPVEGAALFGLRGALGAMGAATAGYLARDLWAAAVHGIAFSPVAAAFRMGVGLLMAVAVGATADGLVRERDRLRELTAELRRRGEELTAVNAALRSARRAQMEFVAVTNHELRTPLTAIKGFALTLTRRWDDMPDDARRAAVEAIEQQSRRLDELVVDLLTVSAIRAGELAVAPQPLPLAPLLRDAVAITRVDATIRCDEGVTVLADRARLLQVVANLLTNARKYGRPPVLVTGLDSGARTVIEVVDHGPGVPPEFVPRMFEEFTQASVGATRTADGHGLGLAIVRYLVTALQGTVAYRPRGGGGSVFTVDLPAGAAGAGGAPAAPTGGTASARRARQPGVSAADRP